MEQIIIPPESIVMISTANLEAMPRRVQLKSICKAISVLDAILCQEWADRYYSYNSKWAPDEEFCGMRNGQGDELLILFQAEGCIINGMVHEYYPKDKTRLTMGLPKIYDEFIFGEPVISIGTTFCLWSSSDKKWEIVDISDFNDGSEEMLAIFDGNPLSYINWAKDYYEENFIVNDETERIVTSIYEGQPLTKEMVHLLANNLEDWDQLLNDLEEINYPFQFT